MLVTVSSPADSEAVAVDASVLFAVTREPGVTLFPEITAISPPGIPRVPFTSITASLLTPLTVVVGIVASVTESPGDIVQSKTLFTKDSPIALNVKVTPSLML